MADTRAGGERVMRKVDLEQDVLTNEERTMMDRMNALQAARAMERSRARWFRRNIILGLALGGVVLGTYGFTMYRVRQETFDDVVPISKEGQSSGGS
ncbi:PREDICTED: cytochrome c oxidase assembly factor 3, mitochondrial-like [Branchiostoma belcheri]|uniref:Cytochrome c oxidase assembly factor 3 n=1 Tax=Branchiostoma belcheri TaxID=7741 RepID=A0A6P4XWW4_BRABE|nr:PREDICTED: cytochrome c oxidase assembly factor 3, mitochondrial-like [Branchiostoma belcheri]